MEYNLSKTIVLIGLMGAGKTAIGTILAEHLGVDFVDSDEEISRAANMSIPEIFDRDGEDFFRLKETQIIGRLLGSRPHILSTGGGAFLSNENRKMISGNAVSVWLDAELETLWDRVKEKKSRPLLMVKDPKTALKNLYISRKPQYAKANIRVKALHSQTIEVMVDRVIQTLLADPISGLSKVEKNA